MFTLLTRRSEVLPFVDQVIAASNQERNALGFLPRAAYSDFAYQDQLIIAVDKATGTFAGYAIFNGALPTAKLRQTYVAPDWRRQGLGETLVAAVVRRCEEIGYLSVKATVASDLAAANQFYEAQEFLVFAEKPGGKSRNRKLLVRAKQLDTPSLFNSSAYAPIDKPSIVLNIPKAGPIPLYLLDLNVLFDVTQQRSRRHAAQSVFAGAFENSVKLAISSEFVSELERHSAAHPKDPVLQLARSLPVVPKPSKSIASRYFEDLSSLVFPSRFASGKMTDRDKADIAHLTTAIVENVAGFVTSEKAMLKQCDVFRERYSVEIVSPATFAADDKDQLPAPTDVRAEVQNRLITSRIMTDADRPALETLSNQLGIAPGAIRTAFAQGTSKSRRTRIVVRDQNQIIATATWQVGAKDDASSQAHIFVDSHDDAAELALDHLIDSLGRAMSAKKPALIWVEVDPKETLIRDRAIHFGFQPVPGEQDGKGRLQKICLGTPVTPTNWQSIAMVLSDRFGLHLPRVVPKFGDVDAAIELTNGDGARVRVKLSAFENFVGPTLMALDERPSIIVPIWPQYAETLFQGTNQPGLFAGQRAGLIPQKCYLSAASAIRLIPDHGLIAFYESEGKGGQTGRSAATALARIQRRYLANEIAATNLAQLRGVLSQAEIKSIAKGGNLCVTEFDNVMIFRNPVPLARLKEIGCADGANLVTARKLETAALLKLIELGEPHAATHN